MIKIMWLICVVTLIGCDNRLIDLFDGTTPKKFNPPELNETFSIPIDQTVTIQNENLNIRFDSVPIDCRCPDGVVCIWEGYYEVILHATDSIRSAEIRLSTLNGDQNVSASFFAYRITLNGLTPHPVLDQPTDSTAYQVMLVVTKEPMR